MYSRWRWTSGLDIGRPRRSLNDDLRACSAKLPSKPRACVRFIMGVRSGVVVLLLSQESRWTHQEIASALGALPWHITAKPLSSACRWLTISVDGKRVKLSMVVSRSQGRSCYLSTVALKWGALFALNLNSTLIGSIRFVHDSFMM